MIHSDPPPRSATVDRISSDTTGNFVIFNEFLRWYEDCQNSNSTTFVSVARTGTSFVGLTHSDSTSGYCVSIGGNLISWKSKKQSVVARSNTETEYRAMASATYELVWLKQLLQELQFGDVTQMTLICDNQVALHISSNPVFHEMTKYIELIVISFEKKFYLGTSRLGLSI